jgi:uncharacterized protein (DUF362 family)
MKRREFLTRVAGWTVGGVALGRFLPPGLATTAKVPVVHVRDGRLVQAQGEQRQAVYREMVERALSKLLGLTGKDAWARLFTPRDVVGIKVNCLGHPNAATSPDLAYALAAGVASAGVLPGQILIFDRLERELASARYTLPMQGDRVRVCGTDTAGFGYESRFTEYGAVSGCLSTIVTNHCTQLINAPVLKDHELAGLTLSLKNYYGVIHNPNKFHADGCNPFVADLNKFPVLRHKQKLIVADATTVLYEGGPSDPGTNYYPYYGLLVGFDPVAVDRMGLQLLDNIRRAKGLPTLEAAGRPAKYLDTAADPAYKLGIGDPQGIELVQEQTG